MPISINNTVKKHIAGTATFTDVINLNAKVFLKIIPIIIKTKSVPTNKIRLPGNTGTNNPKGFFKTTSSTKPINTNTIAR